MTDEDVLIIETAEGAAVVFAPNDAGITVDVDGRSAVLREQVVKDIARFLVGYLARLEHDRMNFPRPRGAC
jgi:hypothetical protein